MPKYIAMQVSESGAPLAANLVQPAPLKSREVRVEIAASGVCHADIGTAAASGKHTVFPVTPGHEIAGTIAEIGENVSRWTVGDRVAIGWFGGNCGDCAFVVQVILCIAESGRFLAFLMRVVGHRILLFQRRLLLRFQMAWTFTRPPRWAAQV